MKNNTYIHIYVYIYIHIHTYICMYSHVEWICCLPQSSRLSLSSWRTGVPRSKSEVETAHRGFSRIPAQPRDCRVSQPSSAAFGHSPDVGQIPRTPQAKTSSQSSEKDCPCEFNQLYMNSAKAEAQGPTSPSRTKTWTLATWAARPPGTSPRPAAEDMVSGYG